MTQPSGADYLNTISQVQNGGNKNETINSYDETVNNNGVTNVSQVNNSFIMSESYMQDNKVLRSQMSEADEVGDLINVQKMEIGYPDV